MPQTWAAQYNTRLLIKLMPKAVVFSFLFLTGHRDDVECCMQLPLTKPRSQMILLFCSDATILSCLLMHTLLLLPNLSLLDVQAKGRGTPACLWGTAGMLLQGPWWAAVTLRSAGPLPRA